jgi:hypothetical protein
MLIHKLLNKQCEVSPVTSQLTKKEVEDIETFMADYEKCAGDFTKWLEQQCAAINAQYDVPKKARIEYIM